MMKNFALYFFLFAAMGCASSEKEKNPVSIKKEELVSLLADIHLSKAGAMILNASDTLGDSPQKAELLAKHHINENDYQKSMAYYGAHPEALSELYGEVIAELTRRQAEQLGNVNKVQEPKDLSNSSAH